MYDFLAGPDRAAFVLMMEYDRLRQRSHWNYKSFEVVEATTVRDSKWLRFRDVAVWLENKRFKVSALEVSWKGYLAFVFDQFKEGPPYPSQLKNEVLFKRYMQLKPSDTLVVRDMAAIYARVLRPSLLSHPGIGQLYGLVAKTKHVL